MKKRGFTLVEVLIALFILAGGLIFLFNSFLASWQSLAYSRKLNEAALLAQDKLEEFKSQAEIQAGDTSGEEGPFRWSLSVQDKAAEAGIQLKQIQLDIEFDYRGEVQKQSFLTYL